MCAMRSVDEVLEEGFFSFFFQFDEKNAARKEVDWQWFEVIK